MRLRSACRILDWLFGRSSRSNAFHGDIRIVTRESWSREQWLRKQKGIGCSSVGRRFNFTNTPQFSAPSGQRHLRKNFVHRQQ
jgi:hypothetical protein